jgi:F0F1-type ATP synthase membrane subunit b/b'
VGKVLTSHVAKAIKKHTQEVKLSLDAIPTMDEKLKSLNNKYSQLYSDFKKQEREMLSQKRKVEQANKEKDNGKLFFHHL